MTRDQVLSLLREQRTELRALGVLRLRLFGSFARDQGSTGSDIDLLVDFGDPPTFDRYMDVKIFLEDLLECRVDLVTETGLRPQIRQRVEAEAIAVA